MLVPIAITHLNRLAFLHACREANCVYGIRACDNVSQPIEGPAGLLLALGSKCSLEGAYESRLTDLVSVVMASDDQAIKVVVGSRVRWIDSGGLILFHGSLTDWMDVIIKSTDAPLVTYLHTLLCREGFTDCFYRYERTEGNPYTLKQRS